MRSIALVSLFLLAACGGGGGGGGDDGGGGGVPASQPSQPATGPGGSAAAYSDVIENAYGTTDDAYWLFEPEASGTAALPIVVMVHGYGALDPTLYRKWIDHVVLRGAIVVYPKYQDSLLSNPFSLTGHALTAVIDAFDRLDAGGHAVPDFTRTAVVGHSFGGVIAANLAVLATGNGLPAFDAVMCCAPGTGGFDAYEDYSGIPTGTLLLSIACADDTVVGDVDAKRIYDGADSISTDDKDYLVVQSDPHGSPPLVAEHGAPTAAAFPPPDALDYFGFWKWFDGLTDAAWFGTNRDYALGDTAAQRFMGLWSDGVPVVEPLVTDTP